MRGRPRLDPIDPGGECGEGGKPEHHESDRTAEPLTSRVLFGGKHGQRRKVGFGNHRRRARHAFRVTPELAEIARSIAWGSGGKGGAHRENLEVRIRTPGSVSIWTIEARVERIYPS